MTQTRARLASAVIARLAVIVCSTMLTMSVFATASAAAERAPPPFAADPYPSTYRPLPRTDTLIVGATVLDGSGRRIDGGDVLLRDGKIAAVGRGLNAQGVKTVDAHGRWVTPGIIDVHSHDGVFSIPQTSGDSDSSDVAELSDPDAADTWIEHAVNAQDPAFSAALRSGVTTLQILPGSTPLFAGRSVIVKPVPAADVYGMKFPGAKPGLKMSCGENPKSFFGEKGRAPNSRQGEVALVRAAFLKGRDYLQAWRAYESGTRATPPKRDLKLDTLAGVLNGDIAVHMHCYRAGDLTTMLDLAAEFGFQIRAFHHAGDAYKVVDQLKKAGTCVAVWSDWWGFKMELVDAIRENAAIVDAAGGCVMMHSDSATVGQRLTIEASKAAAAGRRAGLNMPPEHIIRWVTSTPAKALGLDDRIGTLAPGRNADVVVWSGDPFLINTKADLVFIDGALAFDRSNPQRMEGPDLLLGRPELGITHRADTTAIIHAKAWTMTASTPVENATVVVADGKISSINPGTPPPAGAHVIDAKGKPLTPGLVHPATHLGLLEVSTATDTVEFSTKAGSLGADFDVQYAIDSNSMLVQLARADGLTRAISYPVQSGVAPFAGTGALLRLSEQPAVVESAGIGVFVIIGNHRGEEGSRAGQWELLRHALDGARKTTDAAAPLGPVLAGKVPLAISTNRVSDIQQAIKLAKDYSIRVVIIGGTDAWMVAEELAGAKIPVILDPQANLPGNFDELGARLDNATLLRKAGVTVAIAVLSSVQQSYNAAQSLREGAGLAVANGLPYAEALRSITLVPAEIWGVADRCGSIAPGKDADLVVWDGDPLEPSSAPVAVLIEGKSVSLVTHQKALRDRYLEKAGLPPAPHGP